MRESDDDTKLATGPDATPAGIDCVCAARARTGNKSAHFYGRRGATYGDAPGCPRPREDQRTTVPRGDDRLRSSTRTNRAGKGGAFAERQLQRGIPVHTGKWNADRALYRGQWRT